VPESSASDRYQNNDEQERNKMAKQEWDWTKPHALAIPKRGMFELEQGKHGPIFPRTPACYGFTIIAKIKPGTESAIREHGNTIEKAVEADPSLLAVETPLPALGPVRHRQGNLLHVSRHLRHRIRQIHR
jgi:hypothetical protein